MKSVIMAGGMGTRLRPLTCQRPKPLVPFLGQPMLDHVLNHLEKNGIKEHIITLYHLPQMIIDYLRPKDYLIDFTIEKEPRGTAGSVKEAAAFLKSTFIVVSGDALTDIDLIKASEFHHQKGALATIILTRVAEPLEYGVVLTKGDGIITRFLEKPTWGEVFSDTVNTGIYILEPQILELIPPRRNYDFSKDLFPALLKANLPMYGYIAEGYWSDVGSINQYRQSHWDVLTGKVRGLNGYIDESAEIDPTAMIRQPVCILKKAKIAANVKLGPFVVVGEGVKIEQDSSLSYTIVNSKAYLDRGVTITGAIVGEKAFVGEGTRLLEGSIISEGVSIGERSLITPRVKIYPEKRIGPMSVINTDLIYGSIERGQIFSQKGLRGRLHRDITIDILLKTGVAFSESLDAYTIATACDGTDKAKLVKRIISSGIMAKGADLYDLGDQIIPAFKLSFSEGKYNGGFYVFLEGEQIVVRFLDSKGCYLDSGKERKIENLIKTSDGLHPDLEPGHLFFNPNHLQEYLKKYPNLVLTQDISCQSPAGKRVLEVLSPREQLGYKAQISASGEDCRVFDEKGEELTPAQIEALAVYFYSKSEPGLIKVPIGATSTVEEIASEFGSKVLRVRPGLCYSEESTIPWHDAFRLLSLFSTDRKEPLSIILKKIPLKIQITKELPCSLDRRSQTMLKFAEAFGENSKKEAGLFYRDETGFAYLEPDDIKPIVHLKVESKNMELATELAARISEIIKTEA